MYTHYVCLHSNIAMFSLKTSNRGRTRTRIFSSSGACDDHCATSPGLGFKTKLWPRQMLQDQTLPPTGYLFIYLPIKHTLYWHACKTKTIFFNPNEQDFNWSNNNALTEFDGYIPMYKEIQTKPKIVHTHQLTRNPTLGTSQVIKKYVHICIQSQNYNVFKVKPMYIYVGTFTI
jgi:hypothetical protein